MKQIFSFLLLLFSIILAGCSSLHMVPAIIDTARTGIKAHDFWKELKERKEENIGIYPSPPLGFEKSNVLVSLAEFDTISSENNPELEKLNDVREKVSVIARNIAEDLIVSTNLFFVSEDAENNGNYKYKLEARVNLFDLGSGDSKIGLFTKNDKIPNFRKGTEISSIFCDVTVTLSENNNGKWFKVYTAPGEKVLEIDKSKRTQINWERYVDDLSVEKNADVNNHEAFRTIRFAVDQAILRLCLDMEKGRLNLGPTTNTASVK